MDIANAIVVQCIASCRHLLTSRTLYSLFIDEDWHKNDHIVTAGDTKESHVINIGNRQCYGLIMSNDERIIIRASLFYGHDIFPIYFFRPLDKGL